MKYFTTVNEKFIELLEEELLSRNWTRADLAKKAKISQAVLSLIYSGDRKPGPDVCQAVAIGLKIPPEIVFRAAGLLPLKSDFDADVERAEHLLRSFKTEQYRQIALATLETLLDQEEKSNLKPAPLLPAGQEP